MTSRLMLFVALTVLLLAFAATFMPAQKEEPKADEITIAGYVTDKKGKPIPGVDVSIMPTGTADFVDPTKSMQDGSYKIDAKMTSAFHITYTHTKYNVSVVSLLSEKKNQTINKVLFAKGELVDAVAVNDYLQSIETLQLFAASLDKDNRKKFLLAVSKRGVWEGFLEQFPPKTAKLDKDTVMHLQSKYQAMIKFQKTLE